jgi:hypothetical protein
MSPDWLVSLVAYIKRSEPARIALIVAVAAIVIIAIGIQYAVRYGRPALQPVPRGTSQSACPTPPPGYWPCDPIPINTGFQTGDVG